MSQSYEDLLPTDDILKKRREIWTDLINKYSVTDDLNNVFDFDADEDYLDVIEEESEDIYALDSDEEAAEEYQEDNDTYELDSNEILRSLRDIIQRRIQSWESKEETSESRTIQKGDILIQENHKKSNFNRVTNEISYSGTNMGPKKQSRLAIEPTTPNTTVKVSSFSTKAHCSGIITVKTTTVTTTEETSIIMRNNSPASELFPQSIPEAEPTSKNKKRTKRKNSRELDDLYEMQSTKRATHSDSHCENQSLVLFNNRQQPITVYDPQNSNKRIKNQLIKISAKDINKAIEFSSPNRTLDKNVQANVDIEIRPENTLLYFPAEHGHKEIKQIIKDGVRSKTDPIYLLNNVNTPLFASVTK